MPKTDKRDKKTGTPSGYGIVEREVLKMRRAGELPYSWITDGTRLRLKPDTWSGLDSMLYYTAQTYRKALWDDQNHHVEIGAGGCHPRRGVPGDRTV